MLRVGGSPDDVDARLDAALADGSAYEKFIAMLEAQGGTRAGIEGMRVPDKRVAVLATRDGAVAEVKAIELGELARSAVDAYGSFAGIIVHKRVGDAVHAGDVLAELIGAGDDASAVGAAFVVEDRVVPKRPLLSAVVRDADLAVASNARRG
jgi:pyrimidine-nucleoside phosphorylase